MGQADGRSVAGRNCKKRITPSQYYNITWAGIDYSYNAIGSTLKLPLTSGNNVGTITIVGLGNITVQRLRYDLDDALDYNVKINEINLIQLEIFNTLPLKEGAIIEIKDDNENLICYINYE